MTTVAARLSELRRPDRIAIFVVQLWALCVAVVFLLLGTFDAIRTLVGEQVHLTADAYGAVGAAGRVPGVDGFYNSADLELRGLAFGTRALLATGDLLTVLTTVAIALAVAWLCRRLLRAEASFSRALTRLTVFCALVLIIVPTAGRLLHDLGANQAILQLGLHNPISIGFGFDVTPWIVGIVLAVVGELFRRGERLQHDTEGLV